MCTRDCPNDQQEAWLDFETVHGSLEDVEECRNKYSLKMQSGDALATYAAPVHVIR